MATVGVGGCGDDAPDLERLDDKAHVALWMVKACGDSRLAADFFGKVMKDHTFTSFKNDEDDP